MAFIDREFGDICIKFTYEQLKEQVETHYNALSDLEKYRKHNDCNREFDEDVLSKINEGDVVVINFTNYTFEKINESDN